MSEHLIVADPLNPPVDPAALALYSCGRQRNVRLQIDTFETTFLQELNGRLEDLLYIAAFIYAADTRISRGRPTDVYADSWVRELSFRIPVSDPEFWNDNQTRTALCDTLGFLTGDVFSFEFTAGVHPRREQRLIPFDRVLHPFNVSDVVIPFSGGLDSLAAVVQAISEGSHPLLVSHRPAGVIDARQKSLVTALKDAFPGWPFPRLSMWVNRAGGKRAVETSQRSRAFLFTSLATATAVMLDVAEVRLCDNGIVSINLPRSAQNISTFLSRSTHPMYISKVQDLMRIITERPALSITNTLLLSTKKDVVELIRQSAHPELIQEAVSCAHTEGKTRIQPHCGTCTQCIDRRFATTAANLQAYDLPSRYEKDIFTAPLKRGEERTHAENYIRFAMRLESIPTPQALFSEFAQLYDCIPDDVDADQLSNQLSELFHRHQEFVTTTLEKQIAAHAEDLRRGTLPQSSLLRMVAAGEHLLEPTEQYAKRLGELICCSVPASFQTVPAKNEKHFQDVGQTAFLAAEETLYRETPQLPFSSVSCKPDYSTRKLPAPDSLTVEFKFPKNRGRLNGVVSEMTSRVLIYRDQEGSVLFVVYDPSRTITDDSTFKADFEKFPGVWVAIVR